MIVLWNTLCMQPALKQFRASGEPVNDADVAGLSLLLFEHTNIVELIFFLDARGCGQGRVTAFA